MLDDVIVSAFAPVLIEDAERPESANEPDVAVRLRAPVVTVNPLDAVSVEVTINVPPTVALFVTAKPVLAALNVVAPVKVFAFVPLWV